MQPASRGGTHPRPPRGPRAPLVPDAPFWWKAPLSPPSQTHMAFSAAPTPSASWWVLKQCYWRGPFRAAPGPDQGSVQSGQPRTQVANTPRAGQLAALPISPVPSVGRGRTHGNGLLAAEPSGSCSAEAEVPSCAPSRASLGVLVTVKIQRSVSGFIRVWCVCISSR